MDVKVFGRDVPGITWAEVRSGHVYQSVENPQIFCLAAEYPSELSSTNFVVAVPIRHPNLVEAFVAFHPTGDSRWVHVECSTKLISAV